MATTVTLHNKSGTNGGACDCNDAHVRVRGPANSGTVSCTHAGQTARWDLSALGWDKYEGEECEVAAYCKGFSKWRHSSRFVYALNTNYQFDWVGPSDNPQIQGPN